jgi:hypothetical protein
MQNSKQDNLTSGPDKEYEEALSDAELQQAEKPLVEALARAGIYVGTVSDLHDLYDPANYPTKAIPILIEHLQRRPYPAVLREQIALALIVPAAINCWQSLIRLFESETDIFVKEALGRALSEAATDNVIDDIIRLIKEPGHGNSRDGLLDAFAKTASPQARQVLEELCTEPSPLRYDAQKVRNRLRRIERGHSTSLKIYDACGADKYEYCNFLVNSDDYLALGRALDGSPKLPNWRPLPVEIINKNEKGRKLRFADAPVTIGGLLIFRESVIKKLGPLLSKYGELLPLECAEAKLWLYNATLVLEALNEEESEISRFDSGAIYKIDWAVFRDEAIGDADIFKLSIFRTGPIYFSQRFVDLWKKSGLKGMKFLQVNDVNLFHTILGLKPAKP